jgi:hypothetical protein
MAKRRGTPRLEGTQSEVAGVQNTPTATGQPDASGRVETFAEDLGKLLGTAERKATEWLSQREEVARQLSQLRDKATQLLSQLGLTGVIANSAASGHRWGRPPAAASQTPARRGRPPGKKKRTMSAEARALIAAAQRRRWAKVRREQEGLKVWPSTTRTLLGCPPGGL